MRAVWARVRARCPRPSSWSGAGHAELFEEHARELVVVVLARVHDQLVVALAQAARHGGRLHELRAVPDDRGDSHTKGLAVGPRMSSVMAHKLVGGAVGLGGGDAVRHVAWYVSHQCDPPPRARLAAARSSPALARHGAELRASRVRSPSGSIDVVHGRDRLHLARRRREERLARRAQVVQRAGPLLHVRTTAMHPRAGDRAPGCARRAAACRAPRRRPPRRSRTWAPRAPARAGSRAAPRRSRAPREPGGTACCPRRRAT